MKQILCVVDLTGSAGKVLEVAARIAEACKAHLIVLFPYRLINSRGYQGDIASLKLKLESEARERFGELKKGLPELENLPCEFVCEIGFIFDRIQSYVKRNNVDMVIISQQQTDTANDLRSFNLQKLIADSTLPFVIVPSENKVEVKVESSH